MLESLSVLSVFNHTLNRPAEQIYFPLSDLGSKRKTKAIMVFKNLKE